MSIYEQEQKIKAQIDAEYVTLNGCDGVIIQIKKKTASRGSDFEKSVEEVASWLKNAAVSCENCEKEIKRLKTQLSNIAFTYFREICVSSAISIKNEDLKEIIMMRYEDYLEYEDIFNQKK